MSYRKFNHVGVDYEYIVGKTHTKIRRADKSTPAQLFANSEWGAPMDSTKAPFIVRPSDIKGMLIGERNFHSHPCSRHPDITVTGLSVDPYSSEIDGVDILVDDCAKCLDESSWDI